MAISGSLLTQGSDSSLGGTSVDTASISPTGDALVIAEIGVGQVGGQLPSLSGSGLTWVLIDSEVDYANGRSVYWFRAMGASPSTGAVTISFAAEPTSVAWAFTEYTGPEIDTSGTNGSAAVVQAVKATGTGTAPSATLAAFEDAGNATVGLVSYNAGATSFSPGTGFTELADTSVSQINISVAVQWRSDNDTSVDGTLSTSTEWAILALEIGTGAGGGGGAEVSGSLLTSGGDTTTTDTYNTASITPTGDALVLALVGLGDVTNETPTLSGNGLTWELVGKVELYANGRSIYLFRAMGSSPSSGAVTISFGATKLSCVWVISEFTGVDTSGTNGAGAVEQFATDSGSSQNASVTLAAFASVDNATFGAFGSEVSTEVWTAGTGFTELGEAGISQVAINVMEEWRSDNDTTVTADLDQSRAWGGIAVEIVAGVPSGTPDDLQHSHTLDAFTGTFAGPVDGTPDALQHAHTIEAPAGTFSTPVTVTVSGTKYPVILGSILIQDRLNEPSDARFRLVTHYTDEVHFERGQAVVVTDASGGRIFGGEIDSSSERVTMTGTDSERRVIHSIECIDNTVLAEKRVVADTWEGESAGAIVRDLITDYLSDEGVPSDGAGSVVQDGPTLGTVVFNYDPVSVALDKLAEAAGFWWRIDHDKNLHFVERATNSASWTATQAKAQGTDGQTSIKVDRYNPQYRNKVWILAKDLTNSKELEFDGDGKTQSFPLGDPVGVVSKVEVDSGGGSGYEEKTFGVKEIDTGKDWYYREGDENIVQDSAGTPLTSGQSLRVTFQGLYDAAIAVSDEAEISRMESLGSGSGIVESVAVEPTVVGRDEMFDSGNAKIGVFASAGRVIYYETIVSDALAVGELQKVDFPDYYVDLTTAGDEALVEEIVTDVRTNDLIRRRVKLAEGPPRGSWARFFRALMLQTLANQKRNINEDQTTITTASFSEGVEVGESVTVTVRQCDFPSSSTYPGSGAGYQVC